MPECENCGGHVTRDFVRVFSPDTGGNNNTIHACPSCSTMPEIQSPPT